MVVRIGGINRIDPSSIRLDFVDTNGKILQANILSDKLDSDDVRNATIIPPAVGFKVKLSGNSNLFFKGKDNFSYYLSQWTLAKSQ